jgi:hypothetical protein
LDLIKDISDFVKNINITVLPSINGYPKITSANQLDYGVMQEYKKELFDTFDCDLSEKQFLLCQYNNSMRLVRLQWKNIPKSNKIKKYFKTINEKTPCWLLDEQKTIELLNSFDNHLYNTLFKRYYDSFKSKSNSSSYETKVINLFTVLDAFFSKILIMVVYNTLLNTKSATDSKNDKETYNNLFNAIKIAFNRYLPSSTISNLNLNEFYNSNIQKKLGIGIGNGNEINYTYKLFTALETYIN